MDPDERCEVCGTVMEHASEARTSRVGRRATYCSGACRQRAYRRRTKSRQPPKRTKAGPLASAERVTAGLDQAVENNSFIGREQELADLRRLLRKHRLVTLVGPAGAGKTRLAVELSDGARLKHPDGVHVVEFAPVTRAKLVLSALFAALGVEERKREEPLDTLADAIGEQRILLVLDNCEHLVDACAWLCEALLSRCPHLQVIATSREALRVPGEICFNVGGLYLPAARHGSSAAVLRRSDAVRLFAERAGEVDTDFDLTDESLELVAGVCASLDSMPLAIELAARRTGTFPLAEIGGRLDERLDLLQATEPVPTDRHRDLRAAISWSFDLLTPQEQAVFRRLSLSPSGMSRACATAVCAGQDLAADEVLPTLASLVTKSLVVPTGLDQDRARFRQLDSIRLYGLEQLTESGEQDEVSERLVSWLVELANPLADLLFSTSSALIPLLAQEQELLLYGAEWTAERQDPRQVLLATALARSWQERGQVSEGRELLEQTHHVVSPDTPFLSSLVLHRAWLARWDEDYGEATQLAAEAVKIARQAGTPLPLAAALSASAFMALARRDLDEAYGRYGECADIVREHGSPLDAARCVHNLAYAALSVGDIDMAADLVEQALPVYRRHAAPAALGAVLHTAGSVALQRGDLDGAADCFVKALEASSETTYEIAFVLEGMAIVEIAKGNFAHGIRLEAAAAAQRTATSLARDLWWRSRVDAALAQASAGLTRSVEARARHAGEHLTKEQAIAEALSGATETRDRYTVQLSEREKEVAQLVAAGLNNRRIARKLGIVERTVATHLESMRAKLGASSRTEIAVWAVEHDDQRLPEHPDH